jgi:hypothetical protein
LWLLATGLQQVLLVLLVLQVLSGLPLAQPNRQAC